MIGVDLFSGAGGLSLGATQAGVDVRLAVESDTYAAQTWAHNHPDAQVFSDDIRNLQEINIESNGQQRILFGGPPCQGFSISNRRTRNAENPGNWLFREFMRVARRWEPDWVLMENVRGLVDAEGGMFLEQILSSLHNADYTTSGWVLNSADYGVPQVRQRLFIVGSRHGISVPKP
ncbi:MAG: DNA cytosine methyltransferase, partial [bacterium]|nr:DNA cytosine methyltransferase [bacterium]